MADDLLRTCRKTGCRWPAAASLSYRYDTRQVWLLDLDGEAHPSLYDLCPPHADALTVPRGWEFVDQRTEHEAVREPSGADLTDHEKTPPGAGGYEGNRYAALSAQLPELARAVADDHDAEDHHGDDRDPEGVGGEAEGPTASSPREEAAPAPVPSRDLAPMIVEATAAAAARGDAEARTETAGSVEGDPPADVHEGQLAIPVDAVDESAEDAVVVSIEVAGTRRRNPSWV